jgi:hypothetical protein
MGTSLGGVCGARPAVFRRGRGSLLLESMIAGCYWSRELGDHGIMGRSMLAETGGCLFRGDD